MCGINGIITKGQVNKNSLFKQLSNMNNLIFHRGPDNDGIFTHLEDKFVIGMGMRRLSIIDLNTGDQPMSSSDGNIVIVFNGEIYNYKILKNELEQQHIKFKTNSDTEVILKLYETYGTDSFKKLDGMFAFSIYDRIKNKVVIARDFFGEKPLYYNHNDKAFIWGSELKSVVAVLENQPAISTTALNLFFRLTYIPAPYTIYQNIFKLEANHYIEINLKNFTHQSNQIHSTTNTINKSQISFINAKNKIRDLVFESVASRSVSDVPIGTFLSGGVDSSIVSFCLSQLNSQKIDTFSIGFDKKSFDETDKSRQVAKLINSNHHEFVLNEKDISQNICDILLNFDEPFADSSALPTYLVSNKTSKFVKVALTGDGGDEIFGGYNKYYIGKLNNKYTKIVPELMHNQAKKLVSFFLNQKSDERGYKYQINKLLNTIDYNDNYYWNIISLGFQDEEIKKLLNISSLNNDPFEYYRNKTKLQKPRSLNDFMIIDRHLSLEGDLLVKVDRTSMLNSLECRAPFLNRTLLEFTTSLPETFLLNKLNKKFILKEAFKNDFPDGFLEKSKQGFGVPVGNWLRSGLKEQLLEFTDSKFLNNQQIFNVENVTKLVEEHINCKKDNTFKVWTFFCFQLWYLKTYKG